MYAQKEEENVVSCNEEDTASRWRPLKVVLDTNRFALLLAGLLYFYNHISRARSRTSLVKWKIKKVSMSSSLNSVSEPLVYNVRRARVRVSFHHAVLLFCLLYGGYGSSGLTLHGQQATTTCQDPLSYWDEVNPLIVTDEERVVSWEKDKDGSNSSLCFVYSDR